MPFSKLGLAPSLCAPLARMGYKQPTAIQIASIPHRAEWRRPSGTRPDGHREDRSVRPADDRTAHAAGASRQEH